MLYLLLGLLIGFIGGYIISRNKHIQKQISKHDGVTQVQISKIG